MNTSLRGRALIALCLLSGLYSRAQKTVVTYHDPNHRRIYQVASVNSSGQYNGTLKEYFISGNLAKEYGYRNGEMHGKCTDYFNANGTSIPSSVHTYNNGVAEGIWKEYKGSTKGAGYGTFVETETLYKQGQQLWRKTYQEGEGPKPCLRMEELFYPGSWAVVTERRFYCDGHLWAVKSDTGRNFQEERGTVSMEFYNKNGIRNGPYKEWYPGTKQLGVSGTYRDGQLDGLYREWDKDGVLTVTKLLEEGLGFDPVDSATMMPKADGSLLWMTTTGVKFAEGRAGTDGKPDGEFHRFYGDGKPFQSRFYRSGQLDSVVSWHPDSSVMKRVFYSAGFPDSSVSYHETGRGWLAKHGDDYPARERRRYKNGECYEIMIYTDDGYLRAHDVQDQKTGMWHSAFGF